MPTLKMSHVLTFPMASEASPPSTPTLNYELIYTQRNVDDVVFTGAVTDEDLMGKIANAKAVTLAVLTGTVDVKINGAATPLSLSAGGWVSVANSAATLASLTVSTADAATLRLYMFA